MKLAVEMINGFWQDWWCGGDGALKDAFSYLCKIAQNKETPMADYLNWNATNMQDITFMRAIQDW